VDEKVRILPSKHLIDVLPDQEPDLSIGSSARLKRLDRSSFVVQASDKSEKLAGTDNTRMYLFSVRSWPKNVNQAARDPEEEIGGSTLKKNEGTPLVADDRRLFEQFI
jgi:hypothetical protein